MVCALVCVSDPDQIERIPSLGFGFAWWCLDKDSSEEMAFFNLVTLAEAPIKSYPSRSFKPLWRLLLLATAGLLTDSYLNSVYKSKRISSIYLYRPLWYMEMKWFIVTSYQDTTANVTPFSIFGRMRSVCYTIHPLTGPDVTSISKKGRLIKGLGWASRLFSK